MASYIWVNIDSGSGLLTDEPNYYLNQSWLLIDEIPWYSPQINFTASAPAIILYNEFENSTFEITNISPRASELIAATGDLVCMGNSFNKGLLIHELNKLADMNNR